MSADYYILDARSCVGNCALWWGPDGGGYTCELDNAGLYTLEDASSNSAHHIPVHRSIAEKHVVRHVRWEPLHRVGVGISEAQRGIRPPVLEPEGGGHVSHDWVVRDGFDECVQCGWAHDNPDLPRVCRPLIDEGKESGSDGEN